MSKRIQFPDTLIILLVILVIFIVLTWLLPAGEFARTEINGRTAIVPDSYQIVAANPQGVGALLMAPIKGFVAAASIIAFVFLVGGAFSIVNKTGAIDAGLQRILAISQQHPKFKLWIIPLVMVLFSLCGATFGMSEEVLVFVLITIPLSIALGYDVIVGVAISYVAAHVGFAGAFLNPFTIGIAQEIAELPPFSGWEYRLISWVILTMVAIIFVMLYARRIEKNPEKSIVFELSAINFSETSKAQELVFNHRRKFILLLLVGALAILIFGVSQYGWYINEITALFLALGFCAAVVGRLSSNEAVEAFKDGARDMMMPALVIALAKGMFVVASDGKIIDTILNSVAGLADGLPQIAAVEIMFFLQSFLNLFIPSGSGQAALTMPIMAPLSDLLGISRQTAVLAFQFGDGLTNMIIPTSGVTMGVLAIAKIRYDIWLKWMLPLFIILAVVAMILLALPVLFTIW